MDTSVRSPVDPGTPGNRINPAEMLKNANASIADLRAAAIECKQQIETLDTKIASLVDERRDETLRAMKKACRDEIADLRGDREQLTDLQTAILKRIDTIADAKTLPCRTEWEGPEVGSGTRDRPLFAAQRHKVRWGKGYARQKTEKVRTKWEPFAEQLKAIHALPATDSKRAAQAEDFLRPV
ncbi:MAG: hypothetical protein IPP94_16710 [Ignavibacteria bacterium]|nr:hypothetical protein [Ignavibacteria bacterium]